ncbi:hypothetical protein [Flexithrix dorotheae]|uniref:hypothetical protein n=1 Tax=Flexithrix dorotheae TaxID=70993 RepID=UPI00035D647B|nr:hypothetical protein [Flexithrix dorotheae]
MKLLILIATFFLGVCLTTINTLVTSIDLTMSLVYLASSIGFYYLCFLFIMHIKDYENYADGFFLGLILAGITFPICYFSYSFGLVENRLVFLSVSAIVYLSLLFAGNKILDRMNATGWFSFYG